MSNSDCETLPAKVIPAYEEYARLWGLRMLVELRAIRKLLHNGQMDSDLLREVLELFKLRNLLEICDRLDSFEERQLAPGEEPAEKLLRRKMPGALRRCLKNFVKPVPDERDVFAHNLEVLAGTLGLNAAERLLVHFGLLVAQLGWLHQIAEALGPVSDHDLVAKLACILGESGDEIHAALSADGTLARSGLLRLKSQRGARLDLVDRLEILDGLMDVLRTEHGDTLGIFQRYFRRAGEAELGEEDFAAHAEDYALMREYLRAAHAGSESGINLLIYGKPGVGKTQMARLLAQSLGRPLYEVATLDEDGATLGGKQRLRAYALSQRVLARNPDATVLFDEAEDVFGGDTSFFSLFAWKPGGQTKAAINRLLEENPVPTLWLTNSVESIDPAYLRRFQYVLELRGGTRATRRRNFAKHLNGVAVSPACLDALAEQEALAPAVVANIATVLRRLDIRDPARADATLRRMVNHTLDAMGLLRRPMAIEPPPTPYAPEYSNPDTDLTALVSGLRHCTRARLCLYGPPGTGKTAFGRYLAEQLDKPLLVKRASDLLSMWVGMSERNIANMFREAEREGAVLLLDEADSFLRERRGAHASWEVTQVNEVLTQMEAFEGIFIASTNLMDTLDAASLRRFDFKIRFNYLNPQQAHDLFLPGLDERGQNPLDAEIEKRLNRLGNLAPGDFAVVVRKARVFDMTLDAERLIRGLEDECRAKERDTGRPLGFTASLN